MSAEKIEILVTIKVEEALREFLKLAPAIRKQLKQVEEAFSKVDLSGINKKMQQVTIFVRKKLDELRKSSMSNEIIIKVTNQDAKAQISQIQKQIDSLQEQINARELQLRIIKPRLNEIVEQTTQELTPVGSSPEEPAIQRKIQYSLAGNTEYDGLASQESDMILEILEYQKQIENAKSKMAQLSQETLKTGSNQNKSTSSLGAFSKSIKVGKLDIGKLQEAFSKIPNIIPKITEKTKQIGSSLKGGIKHVLSYAMSLVSLKRYL